MSNAHFVQNGGDFGNNNDGNNGYFANGTGGGYDGGYQQQFSPSDNNNNMMTYEDDGVALNNNGGMSQQHQQGGRGYSPSNGDTNNYNWQQQQQQRQYSNNDVGGGTYNVGGGLKRGRNEDGTKKKDEEKDNNDIDDTPIIGKKFETDYFSRALTRFPLWISVISAVILLALSIALLAGGPKIIANLEGFVPGNSQRYHEVVAMDALVGEWRDVVDARIIANWTRNFATRGEIAGRVTVVFEVDDEKANAYWNKLSSTERAQYGNDFYAYKDAVAAPTMLHIARVIAEVQKLDYFNYASCWSTDNTDPYQFCTPVNSLTQYYYPGEPFVGVDGATRWSFPGYNTGSNNYMQGTVDQIKDAILDNRRFYWYVDEAYETVGRAQMTRIVIAIGTPVQTSAGIKAIPDAFATDMVGEIASAIRGVDHPFVKAYIGGYKVFDAEVSDAAKKDIKWVLISCIFIFVATRIHMHSTFLALCCVFQTLTVFAASLFLYTLFTGNDDLPMLAVILYYAEMLMALAGQMVAFDVFKWSGRLGERAVVLLTVSHRIALVVRHAGAAISMISIIIIAIFAVASAGSSIPVVSDFANMMIIMTFVNWLSLVIYFPACIVVHHLKFSNRRRNLQKQREARMLPDQTKRTRIAAQVDLHRDMEKLYARSNMPSHADMISLAAKNLESEVEFRRSKVSLKAKFNLKPHFRKIGRRAAAVPGDPNHRQWSSGGQGGNEEREFEDDQELDDGFGNVDENGFVVSRDLLTLPMEQVIRIERANCDVMSSAAANPAAVAQITASIQNEIDRTSLEDTRKFRDACGIAPVVEPSQQQIQQNMGSSSPTEVVASKLLEVTRMLIHHVEGYGWAMSIPVPLLASDANKNIREAAPPATNLFTRTVQWCNEHFFERNRKYFFGMLGPHKETSQARVARIKQLSTKKEGANRIERFLGGPFLRMIVGAPRNYIFATLLFAFLVVGAIICGFLDVASDIPTFLPRSSELLHYNQLMTQFGDTRETCDYCSPYFVEQYTYTVTEANLCKNQLGYKTPYVRANICGSCTGDYSCRGCDDYTPDALFDSCRQCLPDGDPRRNKCAACAAINQGSYQFTGCAPCGGGTVGGPGCATACQCSTHGVCNRLTGTCTCHASDTLGFWSGSSCQSCNYGFTGSSCLAECQQSTSNCGCNIYSSRCTTCATGAIGNTCQYQDPQVCHPTQGRMETVGGARVCVCNAGFSGTACRYASDCNGRGRIYDSASVHPNAVGKCVCENNWFGPKCEYCRCYNGGTCNTDGTCACKGTWEGSDCSACSTLCVNGGYCPVQWDAWHYDYFTCRGLFCTLTELANGPTSALCRSCGNRTMSGCDYDARTCTVDVVVANKPSNTCKCRGHWTGDYCTVCDLTYSNLMCDSDGEFVGCDGQRIDRNGHYAVYDRCGRCGGDGVCTGCDGSNSNLKFDKCGVCGGNNTCASALQASETIFIMFEFDATHAITEAEFNWLKNVGSRVWLEGAPFYSISTTDHFALFLLSEPDKNYHANSMMNYLAWALQKRLADYIGFGYGFAQPSFDSPDRLKWIMYEYRANGFSSHTNTRTLQSRYDTLKSVMASIVASAPDGFVLSWSVKGDAFVALGIRDAIAWDTIFVITLSSVITLGLLAVFVCSVKLMLAGTFVLATSIVCAFGTVRVLGLEYGPVEMIMVLFVMVFIASCVIYMADGYMEELHAVQSHLMAETTTRRQNIKGMLRRTGIPISLACIVLFASSLLLLGAEIDVINNVGKIMAICSVLTLAFSMFGFPALLSIFGPHKIRRNKIWMVVVFVIAAIICVIVGVVMAVIRSKFMLD